MSTLTLAATDHPEVRPVVANDITRDRIDLWKRTYCKGSSDDELAMFVTTCQRTGLSPEARQIYAVKRWDNRERREVMNIQVSIDGFRLIADRAASAADVMRGEEPTQWCGDDGVWREEWLSSKPPVAARYTTLKVTRHGQVARFTAVARFDAYCQRTKDGRPASLWASMPETMIAKCAEALCLRKAYPAELSGLYTTDEMAQAEAPAPPARITVPAIEVGSIDQDGEPVVRTGDAKKRLLDMYIAAGFTADEAKTYAAAAWRTAGLPTAGFVTESDIEAVVLAVKTELTGTTSDPFAADVAELDAAFDIEEVA